MPPKKEPKEKQIKGDEADELVLQYLKSVNRPYASTDVSANLKNKVPKAAAQKVMQALADRGEITLKPYGKQTIFVYNQDNLPVMSAEDMATLDEELKSAQDSLKEQREQLKELERNLAAVEALPKTQALPIAIKEIEEQNAMTLRTLAPYRKNCDEPQVRPLTPEEIKQIDAEFVKWRKQWVDRRRMYKIITDQWAESGVGIDAEWRDCQGITEDDDEAIALETGEFCKPQVTARSNAKSKAKAKPLTPPSRPSSAATAVSKRSLSDTASSQEPAKPKKKAKKA